MEEEGLAYDLHVCNWSLDMAAFQIWTFLIIDIKSACNGNYYAPTWRQY